MPILSMLRPVLAVMSAAALALSAGCTSEVASGGAGGGGTKGGDGGAGGGAGGGTTACTIGETRACEINGAQGEQDCYAEQGTPTWSTCVDTSSTAASTPLVLVFGDGPVSFEAGTASFDLTGRGECVATDWPSAATPWLALDRDGSGAIEGGSELFGSAVSLASGKRALNGFEALRELDSNADGRIDRADAAWSSLVLWSDANGDRRSAEGELNSLAARRVVSIDLAYEKNTECDARGNCAVERARFTWQDGAGALRTGSVVDVHLAFQSVRF